jgi:membrane protease subunit HflC
MRSARRQEALTIRAQGAKQAQIIRAEAEAEAARTYAEAYGRDPDFYDFVRAMESYRTTFGVDSPAGEDRGEAAIVMSPDNEYLRQFRGQR